MNVLVVDDDPVARTLLEALLRPLWHTVATAAGGREAWDATRLFRIEKRSDAAFSHGICPDCYAKHVEPQLGGA